MPKRKPRDIAIDRAAGELVVLWRDGGESRYGLEALRRACPCAAGASFHAPRASPPRHQLVSGYSER